MPQNGEGENSPRRSPMSDQLELDTAEHARKRAAAANRIVVKAGTNTLTDDESHLDRVKVDRLVDDVMAMIREGIEILLVSSGAIGAGIGRVEYTHDTVEESQALSTVGQPHLMRQYSESFERYGRKTAQLLLTQDDLEHPDRFTNLSNTIETLFEWGIVPIINENDAVATEEIQIGDNDMLSSSVAIGMDVDLLVTLTDVGGVYTGNPKEDAEAERIEVVGQNYNEVERLVDESASGEFGGIRTKVAGARAAGEHGIPAIIANSADGDALQQIVSEKAVGTLFLPANGEHNG